MIKVGFNPESQQHLVNSLVDKIDSHDYVTSDVPYFSRGLEKHLGGITLGDQIIYAHIIFGGNPLVALPFLNAPDPGEPDAPASHALAVLDTVSRYGLTDVRKNVYPGEGYAYWSLYAFISRESEDIFCLTCGDREVTDRTLAVREMLKASSRLRLFLNGLNNDSTGGHYNIVELEPGISTT